MGGWGRTASFVFGQVDTGPSAPCEPQASGRLGENCVTCPRTSRYRALCTLRAIGVWEVGGELRHTCLQTSRYRALCTLRAGPLWARQMGIPTSVSIGSMVNLPPTARSEDYVGACNCKYLSREKPRNRYMRYPCPEIIISLLIPPAPCAHCDTSAPCAPCDTLLILCASDCALVSCAHYLTRAPATSRARARPTTDGRP